MYDIIARMYELYIQTVELLFSIPESKITFLMAIDWPIAHEN